MGRSAGVAGLFGADWPRVLWFAAVLTALIAAVWLVPLSIARPVTDATALVAHSLLGSVGIHGVLDGSLILLSERTLLINRECTAAYLIALFAALVITFPASARSKLGAFAVGVPVLLACNMVRIIGAGLVAVHVPNAFDLAHDYIFTVLLMFVVLGLWFAWITRLGADES